MKKIIFNILFILIIILPISISADTIVINCDKMNLKIGESTTCVLKGTTTSEVLRVDLQINLSNNLNMESITKMDFEGGNALSNLSLNTIAPKSGTFNIATFVVKAKSSISSNEYIQIKNITFINENESISISNKTFYITIYAPSTVNTLENITVSNGTLSPSFNKNILEYSSTINAQTTTINVIKTDSKSSVSGNGIKNLSYGLNTFNIDVKSESGITKTYKLNITRLDTRNSDNTLSSLSVSNAILNPPFDKNITNYSVKVGTNIDKVIVSASKSHEKAMFVSGYGSREVKLEYGNNTVLVKVLSESEIEKVYKLDIVREDTRDNNTYLKSLVVKNGKLTFDKEKLEYIMTVNYEVENVVIQAETESDKSTVRGIGKKDIKVGVNDLNIVVTAENMTTKTYKLKITRLNKDESPSSNAYLKTLEIEGHDITFDKSTYLYELKLNTSTNILNISYTPDDPKAVVTLLGNNKLKNGSVIQLVVTSTDGTEKIYEIKINKNDDVSNKGKTKTKAILSIISILIGIISLCSILVYIFVKPKVKAMDM